MRIIVGHDRGYDVFKIVGQEGVRENANMSLADLKEYSVRNLWCIDDALYFVDLSPERRSEDEKAEVLRIVACG